MTDKIMIDGAEIISDTEIQRVKNALFNGEKMKKCYKCPWHTDKCKNRDSKNFNKFPDEVKKCDMTVKYRDKTYRGITKQVYRTTKDRKCYFCGAYIPRGSGCLVTVDFEEHNVKYSCMDCSHGIIALYGD